MTIYICNGCGHFYNSAVLKKCPFCKAPAVEQNNMHSLVKAIAEDAAREIMDEHLDDYEHQTKKVELYNE